MPKRLLILAAGFFLACPSYAGTPPITAIHTDPAEIPVQKSVKVLFTAHIASDAQHVVQSVRLLRLQWSGSELPVSEMWDDGSHGDAAKNDGTYGCTVKIKEAVIGLLSFRVEVRYKGLPAPVSSQAIFLNVVGGR